MLDTPGLDAIFRPVHPTDSRNLTEMFRTRCSISRSQEHVLSVPLCMSAGVRAYLLYGIAYIRLHVRLCVWVSECVCIYI
jgi:hypothetical protein